ncbi:MAG TPA: carboxylating nicotinate-nucleotide diphosphorylase [Candidatus Ozemobacteraceae bacterium]|nr:carboxylating nicotinate-nucleotide diphosphorylase [Candidatus Ozemobacteraceae bacterium]
MIRTFVQHCFDEDLGPACRDVSVHALSEAALRPAIGLVRAKASGLFCGGFLFALVVQEATDRFSFLIGRPAAPIIVSDLIDDGSELKENSIIARLSGPTGALLMAERILLNLLQRLSGVATLTRQYVDQVKHTSCRILDTRKTTPGLRALEKRAVQVGGGVNHRQGLYDMVMLKDNHITAMGGDVSRAVLQARQQIGPTLRIEVETSSLAQVQAAVEAGANVVMLDNMSPQLMRECVAWVNGCVPVEASGGITLENVRAVAETGVDYISVGALTHSAPALDISMKITVGDRS